MKIKKLNKGFTLMEIMIAIVILSTMATILITNVTGQQKKSKSLSGKNFTVSSGQFYRNVL